ncbi:MAG: aminoacyl-tRNA hydrolase [Clostridia bacterium]|nr:aminoacyl-tRNA hydrolase [Clostridia bacterium]
MYIVVGLGNPDKKYLNTLHNIGFMAIDKVAEKLGVSFNKKGFKGQYLITTVNGEKVVLLKPQTYMNLSGESVLMAVNYYKVKPENLIVIYDDLDINIGSLRIRKNGSAGTHNGMKNIVSLLGSTEFPRFRVGIKPENDSREIIDYVLSDIKSADVERFNEVLDKTSNAVVSLLKGDSIDVVMNKYNG